MERTRRWRWLLPSLTGLVATGAALGVAQLVAAIVAPGAGPFVVVGSLLIDASPAWAKHLAIGLFGKDDKAALLVGVGVALAIVAALAGVLEVRRPPVGRVLIGAAAAFGIVAAATRAHPGPLDPVPAIAAGLIGILLLGVLANRMPERAAPAPERAAPSGAPGPAAPDPSRRLFVGWAVGAAVAGALATAGGAALGAGARTVSAVRMALKLPMPAVAAPPLPAGADFGIPGLARIVTPSSSFYRIDTALAVPQIDPDSWRLLITGMVDREVTLTWKELLTLPLEESYATLACVSNEVGGDLIGNARWLGYPIRHLLERAGPSPDADMVLSTSQDGFTAGTPLEALTDPERAAILAVGMNGEPLPPEHGFPVRMVVPGLYGYVSATKWVVKLEVTRYDRARAYWTEEGWAPKGPVKLESRIDVVRKQGDDGYVIAGVAWHQHVGVKGVEVRIDDGAWQTAQLSTPISADTWVQWRLPWHPERGSHTISVRARGADGELQTATRADVVPDGATGYHTVTVTT
jgi:DMSO/TMAO reductase YedYZ molybdopterin-dependent catalytic subunit